MQVTLIEKPILSVQCNWNEALRERNGDAWVTCKSRGQPGIHGKLRRTGSSADGTPMVSTTDKFRVTEITKDTINVSHTDPNCQTCFIAPTTAFANVHKKSVACLDVTKGHLGVSASGTSEIRVWDSRTGEVRRDLEGHVWDVYTCRFFPSGVVVLSGGADMQLKIWSAETGKCPVTLKGHSAAINDTCIVEQGRNVISVSKDGTARLWDCGKSACLGTLTDTLHDCINCCALGPVAINLGTRDEQASEREVATDGKLLVVGTEAGKLRGVGVHSRKTVFELDHPAAINCCCFLGQNCFLFGTQDGTVSVIDVRQTREPSITWKNSSSAVLCLLPYKQGFMVGRADGSCNFEALVGAESFSLTGPDCEPVYSVAYDGESFYTACRDGLIRKYRVPKS
ncbi:proteasomal ATPase-associated factor 1 [Rhipicephalus microplus]|uniref:proteasomal ATPase-associated factor 1 n=1 Tax=Rhipicephalus microplus TaxID=6941 RepID=UPI003F6BD352